MCPIYPLFYFFLSLLLETNIAFLLESVAYHGFSARILFFCLSILSEHQKKDEAQRYHKVVKRKRKKILALKAIARFCKSFFAWSKICSFQQRMFSY